MMKRWIAAICILCALLCGAACAEEYSPGYLMQPPREVLEHLSRSFPGYTLEDYCEVYDTPDGDYGFALLTAGDERLLLGYEEKDGRMSYWLKNHGAVMQGAEEAWFDSHAKGTTVYGENHEVKQADGLSFSITQLDSAGETYNEYVAYHWEDGGFKLTGYKDWDGFYGEVAVEEGVLHFKNWLEGWDFGKVYGTVQRDLRYVVFSKLPKTIEEAKMELSSAPEIPGVRASHDRYALRGQEIRFAGGRNYPVYNGPGEQYARAGNGRASVSTNDWIQVFGEYDGWILIQYDISSDHYRFGWIDAGALPQNAQVEALEFHWDQQEILLQCVLTDDPLQSGTAVCEIDPLTPVYALGWLGEAWEYIYVEIDGKPWWGFVCSDALTHG